MKVLDTSVAVDHLRGFPAAGELLHRLVATGEDLIASEIVRFELAAGVREEARGALEEFFRVPTWVPVDEAVARRAGELAREHRASHGGIDAADFLIAATVQLFEADLLTTNVRHFPMLPGLRAPY
ncbi:MAG: type II toxin-antitoxin system VapC family toxin [Thermoanaerobaculia bacterium]